MELLYIIYTTLPCCMRLHTSERFVCARERKEETVRGSEAKRVNARRIKKKIKLQGVRVIVYYYNNFFLCTKIIVNKFNKKITMIDTLVYAY